MLQLNKEKKPLVKYGESIWFILYFRLACNSFDKLSNCHCLAVKFHHTKLKNKTKQNKTNVQPYCSCGLTFCKQMFLGAEEKCSRLFWGSKNYPYSPHGRGGGSQAKTLEEKNEAQLEFL